MHERKEAGYNFSVVVRDRNVGFQPFLEDRSYVPIVWRQDFFLNEFGWLSFRIELSVEVSFHASVDWSLWSPLPSLLVVDNETTLFRQEMLKVKLW